MPFILGLTGGIGSGKTAASQWFERQAIDVVDADIASRQVVEPGRPALQTIVERFGPAILNEQGGLDRPQLRAIVFSDPTHKHWLEQLLHPLIRQEIIQLLSESTSAYAILVSPLLFETNQHLLVNRSLLIDVSEDIQIQRVKARDHSEEQTIKSIIESQMSRDKKRALADDIVENDQSLEVLYAKLMELHQHYLTMT